TSALQQRGRGVVGAALAAGAGATALARRQQLCAAPPRPGRLRNRTRAPVGLVLAGAERGAVPRARACRVSPAVAADPGGSAGAASRLVLARLPFPQPDLAARTSGPGPRGHPRLPGRAQRTFSLRSGVAFARCAPRRGSGAGARPLPRLLRAGERADAKL